MEHKAAVLAMTKIEDVEAFNATAGYPNKLHSASNNMRIKRINTELYNTVTVTDKNGIGKTQEDKINNLNIGGN